MYRRTLVFMILAFTTQSCLVGRFVWYNFAGIQDYKIFPSRPLPKSEHPFQFVEAFEKEKVGSFPIGEIDSMAKHNNSVAFLVIRNDSLLFERYYQGYEAGSPVASFSMAKSYTSALIGVAIRDGYIKSVDDPVIQYVPELKDSKGFEAVKLKHLLQMTSGIKANESYFNPFGQAAKLYYGRTLRKYLTHLKLDYEPGSKFAYRSVNSQLLGLVLERATGKSVTEYMNEKIWSRIGTEYDATWSIDKKNNGLEKTFCCINAVARDYAKLGRLYLNNGNWEGNQLVPREWVTHSTQASLRDGGTQFYQYQWWLGRNYFFAQGVAGQFIYVHPGKKVIIIRLGKSESKVAWPQFFNSIARSL